VSDAVYFTSSDVREAHQLYQIVFARGEMSEALWLAFEASSGEG